MNTAINTAVFLLIVGATSWVGPALDEIAEKPTKHKSTSSSNNSNAASKSRAEMCGNGVAVIDQTTVTCKVRKALRGSGHETEGEIVV